MNNYNIIIVVYGRKQNGLVLHCELPRQCMTEIETGLSCIDQSFSGRE